MNNFIHIIHIYIYNINNIILTDIVSIIYLSLNVKASECNET